MRFDPKYAGILPRSCSKGNHLVLAGNAKPEGETVHLECEYCAAEKDVTAEQFRKMMSGGHRYLLFTLP